MILKSNYLPPHPFAPTFFLPSWKGIHFVAIFDDRICTSLLQILDISSLILFQQSMNGSAPSSFHPEDLQCRITDSQEINCSSKIYTSPDNWRTSRTFINEQIRRLRSQLFELKVKCCCCQMRVLIVRSRIQVSSYCAEVVQKVKRKIGKIPCVKWNGESIFPPFGSKFDCA